MTTSKPYHHGDLRRQLVAVGEEVLAERGIAALSLREVARRLGVSHNAPFKHFASREALLAAMAEQGFEDLAERLAGAMVGDPHEAMTGRALAYVTFALERPAVFRLMFGGQVDAAQHPALAERAEASLRGITRHIAGAYGEAALDEATLSAWAFVHGLANLLLDGQISEGLRKGRSNEELAKAVIAAMATGLGHRSPDPQSGEEPSDAAG
jgi:AcrR family transcriptional regulator